MRSTKDRQIVGEEFFVHLSRRVVSFQVSNNVKSLGYRKNSKSAPRARQFSECLPDDMLSARIPARADSRRILMPRRKKPGKFQKAVESRRLARERVGTPPPARVIADRRKKPARHKKEWLKEDL